MRFRNLNFEERFAMFLRRYYVVVREYKHKVLLPGDDVLKVDTTVYGNVGFLFYRFAIFLRRTYVVNCDSQIIRADSYPELSSCRLFLFAMYLRKVYIGDISNFVLRACPPPQRAGSFF